MSDHYDRYNGMEELLGTDLAEVGTDLISRQAAIDRLTEYGNGRAVFISVGEAVIRIEQLPPAQSETAKRIIGKSKDGITLWYQCDMCNEPVDAQDNFCRECGRRLIDE